MNSRGCCSRQTRSCTSLGLGLLLLLWSVASIFWTENEAVVSYATANVVRTATQLHGCRPSERNTGALVLAACEVSAPNLAAELPAPLKPFLPVFNGSSLHWKSEIYMYREKQHEECEKVDNEGGRRCSKVYTCDLTWSDSWIDSSAFRCPQHVSNQGHRFPSSFPAKGEAEAPEYSIVLSRGGRDTSGLALNLDLQRQLPPTDVAGKFTMAGGGKQTYRRNGGVLSAGMLQVNGPYLTTFLGQPQVGDLRISFRGHFAPRVTVAAKQGKAMSRTQAFKLGPWPPQQFDLFGKQTKPLQKLFPGHLSVEDFVEGWNGEITGNLWSRRFTALVLMILAFELILQPLSAATELLRTIDWLTCGLGGCLEQAAQCLIHSLAISAATILVCFIVGIAWVVARPLLGCLLLAAALATLAVVVHTQRKRTAQVAMADVSTGLISGIAVAQQGVAAPTLPVAMVAPVTNAPPAAPTAPVLQTMQVTCPAGIRPGESLTIKGPNGQMFTAEVPLGVQPGQVFAVQMSP